ncbi:MAG: ATP-binding protein [Tepidiformaceae bacterium]
MGVEFRNPFRPGAGHMPPYLAGREHEKVEFGRILGQQTILENSILTGLRGVGKTVLLETFKPMAIQDGWLWVGTDLSESSSVSEESLSVRLLTDLAVVTSGVVVSVERRGGTGLTAQPASVVRTLDYPALLEIWAATPGLAADKLKNVLETVWEYLRPLEKRGVIFAYDEAQNLADHAQKDEYPLSLILDVFQSIQRKGIPFMLVLTGLPTLFPKLVESRTFAERMFHQIFLDRLGEEDSKEAIVKPISDSQCPLKFTSVSVQNIFDITRGYPYFIQYVCREVFDIWSQQQENGQNIQSVPVEGIMRKLDSDFFAGRWSRATDRQRDLLGVIANLENCTSEFTVQEVVNQAKIDLDKPFSSSHVNQMLVSLSEAGLIYKNRWGRYSFAVPLLDQFIRRQSGAKQGKLI